ncbi:WecB/TagA/CpsF family glycosyltransferase [Treponema parvum]|uniref:WecB/TagA/CpsF family glycosyltransferase n=1 Tax=Treponema parvum TaxID=138851 RepID=A0A975F180_9SPIR|nr:WecB/TagA/CpsF family glycosyltransferase [Treponema parvum]QTQ12487.1 WecB/TagA/CpsF family glycosyltransferase [Treponema parvum]QTQ15518.1 WecB/TagA/CpsF family glycosyltransferase [Treponema parvum]
MALQRIEILGVPVDVCRPEEMEGHILELLAKPGTKQIVFLSVWNLLRARGQNDYAECVRNADLVLPVSKSILRAAEFLKKPVPVRYNPFTALINILSILEIHYKTLFLLGGYKKQLDDAENNVRSTFPKLHIVGRCTGKYTETFEKDVVQAVFKASPSLALLCSGIKEKDVWAYRRRNQFSSSIFLYYKDAIGIFSKRLKRISDDAFDKGFEIFHEILHNPLKLFLVFPFLWFTILLVWYRLKPKG